MLAREFLGLSNGPTAGTRGVTDADVPIESAALYKEASQSPIMNGHDIGRASATRQKHIRLLRRTPIAAAMRRVPRFADDAPPAARYLIPSQ